MKRMIAAAIFGAALLALPVFPQSQDPAPRGRRAVARQLRADWERALANSTLTVEEKDALRKDLATIRSAARARRAAESVDREAVRGAAQRVREFVEGDKIRPEDREAIRKHRRGRGGSGNRGDRRFPPPGVQQF